ncbi:MAG: hypothetical protein A2Y97_07670 [Nitrospirae bacterium RBG_13_39_12]|nr:MAG: hypothetical protein A2Y97_07670 [Nitrospirae bacterium RBG_13_39_12]
MDIIDIHTHGIGGYDTRTTAGDHILRMAEIHGSYGVSAIIPTIYPAAINVMKENMKAVKNAIEKQKTEHRTQKSKSSEIIGVHLEGPFLNPAKCGALSAESFIEPTEYSFKELIEGFEDMVKIITVSPEIKGAEGLIKKMSDMGIIVSMGHSNAKYAEAEAGFNAGARGVTHIFNAMSGFHHREPGLAGFGLLNQNIYIEVIADPYHLHLKTVELIFRTKNHDRIIIVSDTVKQAGTSSYNQAITGSGGRLSGGCMPVTESSKRLIEMGYDKNTVLNCITKNPVRYLSGK